ncbi:MAG: hypothetical protein HDT04_05020 [Bacteroidales bacterium]|nr:hypothetical protein [Bacteroidales bacterium]
MNQQVMDFSFFDLNFNSVENLPGFEARSAFTVKTESVFRILCRATRTILHLTFGEDSIIL